MNRPVLSTIALLCIAVFAGPASSDFYHRAPDVLPGLLPEMYTADFWISKVKNPDEVVLTSAAIRKMNESYMTRMKAPDLFKDADKDRVPNPDDLNRWPGRYIVIPDLSSMTSAQVAAATRNEVVKDVDFMRGKYSKNVIGLSAAEFEAFGNMLGIGYADWELDRFEKEMAVDLIGDTVTPLVGITVRDARLRIVPTFTGEQIGIMDNMKTRWDVWNVGLVRIGTRVSVLHSSRSGGYVFALTPEGFGWIQSEDVAFASEEEISTFSRSSDFVVCTGDRVPFYSDEKCRFASGWMRLGDRLPLASKENSRLISVPVRKTNGNLSMEHVWLAEDADVHAGWMPYTRRNIAVIGFKMLGNPYDWTMAWYGRNHETTLRDLFACFGFELPFNAELFTFYSDNDTRVVRPNGGKEEQYKTILSNEPLLTIQTCGGGHSQLFLGEYNGEPFVLDTHGYGYEKDGERYEIRRLTVSDMSLPEYFLKTNFTFCVLK